MFYEDHSDNEISESQKNTQFNISLSNELPSYTQLQDNSPNNIQHNQNARQIHNTITNQPIRQNNNSEQDINHNPYLYIDTQPPSYDQIHNNSKGCYNDNENKKCKTVLCLCSIAAITFSGCAVGCLLC